MKKDDKIYPLIRNMGIAVTIPMVFVAGPIVGFFIGSWMDQAWQIEPWGKTIFILLGFVASVKQVIDFINRATK